MRVDERRRQDDAVRASGLDARDHAVLDDDAEGLVDPLRRRDDAPLEHERVGPSVGAGEDHAASATAAAAT